jgi:hypothetical protein
MATVYTHSLAYRDDTGEVEGFVGTAFDKGNARANAFRKIIRKCQAIDKPCTA